MAQFTSGQEIQLDTCELYIRWFSKKPSKIKSGNFYIYNSTVKENRIRICDKLSNVNIPGKSIGWINIGDIIDNNLIKVGSLVMISGTTYQYATGTGTKSLYYKTPAYITDILDPSEFKYRFGFSLIENGARVGFCTQEMISHYIDQNKVRRSEEQTITK